MTQRPVNAIGVPVVRGVASEVKAHALRAAAMLDENRVPLGLRVLRKRQADRGRAEVVADASKEKGICADAHIPFFMLNLFPYLLSRQKAL